MSSRKQKQLQVTPEMLTQVQRIADADISADAVVVFEATAVNTRPVRKDGSIFDGARLTRATLIEMADRLNTGAETIPLHTMHMQGDEIPVGKLFAGSVQDTLDGEAELLVQFYMPKSEASLVERINLGILDETSIGLKSKHLLCSECGWDYFGPEANFLHLWDRTCQNDHVIGVDGTHVILSGVDAWMELSLVSRGAAQKAKIHGRIPKEQQDRIAASGFEPDVVTLFASATPQAPVKKEADMTAKPEVPATPAAPAEFDAKAAFEDLSAKLLILVEKLAPAAKPEPDSELDALKAEIGELKESLANLSKPKAADMTTDLPAGGVAADAITDAETAPKGPQFSAFKTRK